MSRLLLLLLAAFSQAEPVAVDACLLREYVEECDSELAPLEATRLVSGIPAECRS